MRCARTVRCSPIASGGPARDLVQPDERLARHDGLAVAHEDPRDPRVDRRAHLDRGAPLLDHGDRLPGRDVFDAVLEANGWEVAHPAGCVVGLPLALGMTGNSGAAKWMRESASRTGCTAGAMSGEWKAPATCSRTAFAPRLRASSSARVIAARDPESTVCFGAFSLATASVSPRPATSHTSRASSSERPMIAVMVPGFASDACAIACARAASADRPG